MLRRLRFFCSRLKEAKARRRWTVTYVCSPRRQERRDASRCSDEVLQRLGAGLLCGSGSLRLRLQIVPDSPALHAAFPKRKLLAPSDEAVPRKRRCTSDMERESEALWPAADHSTSGGGGFQPFGLRDSCWKMSSPFSIDWRHTAISVINLSLINDFIEFVFTHREQKEKKWICVFWYKYTQILELRCVYLTSGLRYV